MKLTPINGSTETEGTEFVYRGISLKVARAANVEFKKEFHQAMKPYKSDLENGTMRETKSREIMAEIYSKTILVDWYEFTDTDGKEWEYSQANAYELLIDDNDAYEAIVKFSEDINNYLNSEREDLQEK